MKRIIKGQAFTIGLLVVLLLAYWSRQEGPPPFLHLEITTQIAVAVIFFLQGLNLAPDALRRGFTSWKVQLFVYVFGFALMPLTTLLCTELGWVSSKLAPGMLFLAILPTTISTSVVYSDASGGDTATSTVSAAFSNLLGVLAVPVLSSWLIFPLLESGGQGTVELGFFTDSLGKLLKLIAAPMFMGWYARRFLARWVEGRDGWLRNGSFSCVLFIAYAGFCKGFQKGPELFADNFFWEACLWVGAFLVFANLSAALLLAMARFNWPQVITAFYASTQKSLAVGLPMGYLLFVQEGSQASSPSFEILLPLILFHPLQLLLGATLCPLLRSKVN